MYKHILLPTDGSKLSAHAIAQGVALARAAGARITGLFVAPAPTPLVFEGLRPVAYMQPEEHAALTRRAAEKYLGAIDKAAAEAGVLLGSETQKVLTHAKAPVLVCRRTCARLT